MTVKCLLHSLTIDYFFSCSVLVFWTDLHLGGTLLFPIDDKKSRKKGQDLVRMRNSFLCCSVHVFEAVCNELGSFSQ